MAQREMRDGVQPRHESNEEFLRQRGYRLTPQRYLILRLIRDARTHLTAEELLERVRQQYPRFPLSTMYRTLELLEELHLVRGTYFPGERHLSYEAYTGHTHHHLVCRKCGATIHLDETLQEELYDLLQKRYRYHELTLDMMSVGCCEACWQSGLV